MLNFKDQIYWSKKFEEAINNSYLPRTSLYTLYAFERTRLEYNLPDKLGGFVIEIDYDRNEITERDFEQELNAKIFETLGLWTRHNNDWGYLFCGDLPHTGFYLDVDGQQIHVLGDPNAPEETMDALREMVRAATKAMREGEIGKRK